MDFRQIRSFVHVADLCSFTKASAFLGISQPALSRQMRLLEEELGTQLFHRTGHGVSLTLTGLALLERCTKLLNEFESIRRDFATSATKSRVTGSVGIGLPIPIAQYFAQPFLQNFQARFPGISLRIVEGFSALLHEWVLSGSIELAISYGPRPSKALKTSLLLNEDLYAIGAATAENRAKGALTPTELGLCNMILPHRPHVLRDVVDQLDITPKSVIEADALTLMLELASTGHGYTLLGLNAVKHAVAAGKVVAIPIHKPSLNWDLSVCYSSLRPMNDATKSVITAMREEFRRLVRNGEWIARLPTQSAGPKQ
jgi:LysR family nitrogen assimilation transcriptional regulator